MTASIVKDVEKLKPSSIAGRNVKCAASLKNSLNVSKMLTVELPYDLAVPLLSINSKEMKTHIHLKNLCMGIHSSIIHNRQMQKQHKCSSTDEGINVYSVTQLCPTLCNPMVCSPPDSSVHGDSPGKNTSVGCHALLQGIFPT